MRWLIAILFLTTLSAAQSGVSGGTVTSTGAIAANDCVKFVSSSVITSAGGACGTSSGTVTSVGFTGGLISVATATTTPALTVAGTSGGIPYFSAASTWASSGVLATGQFVLGGGAGATPTTSFSIVPVANGGTGNAFFTVSGPASSAKTYTFPNANATMTITVASGAKALATGAITSATCTTAQTDTATGALTTDTIAATFNGDPTAVTGYIPLTAGMLTIIAYPTADTVNFKVCNNTTSSVTPGAVTINWRVTR